MIMTLTKLKKISIAQAVLFCCLKKVKKRKKNGA